MATATPAPALATVGEIGRRLNRPTHKIAYVIRTRGIRPASTAGNLRVFSEDDVRYIESELRRIDEEKGIL